MRVRLQPLGEEADRPIELVNVITLIGREEWCDFTIEHKSVSKMHCLLAQTQEMVYVRDLGSTNGTRVNDHRVRRATLFHNDELSIAGRKFRVLLGDVTEVPSTQAATQAQMPDADESNLEFEETPQRGLNEPLFRRNQLPDGYGLDEQSSSEWVN